MSASDLPRIASMIAGSKGLLDALGADVVVSCEEFSILQRSRASMARKRWRKDKGTISNSVALTQHMSTTTATISPADEDLADALRKLRVENPSTGAAKLVPLVISSNPTWTVSEKRVRKILQREGLSTSTNTGAVSSGTDSQDGELFPQSHIVPSIDPAKWSKNVRVTDFGPRKGKGLVAIESIPENEHIWVEDPLLTSPEA